MKIISRSVVRTATKGGEFQNLRANALAPTLAPKPVTNNLKINDTTQPITVKTVEDEGDDVEETVFDDDGANIAEKGKKKGPI